jgi:hypothetical protein
MKKFLLTLFAMITLSNLCVNAVPDAKIPEKLPFIIELVDPTIIGNTGKPKSPVVPPEVYIAGHTLLFSTPCDGCILRLEDEMGNEVYTTTIPENTTTLELPYYLTGEYKIQIIRGNFCFYTYIDLSEEE